MQEASGLSTTPNAARTISCKAWNSPAEYPSWVARCDIKGSISTVLNPIFSKKVQGQKHPGRRGIVEHQIPSIKMLFKTNTKSHKHPSIRFLSKSKTQLVNQRKQKVAFSPGTAHSPIERDGVQLRQYWILNSLAWSKLRLCSANHRPGYWSNLPCDWPSTAWAYSEQETENRPRTRQL